MKHWYLIALLALCGCGKELLEPDPVDRGRLPIAPYVAIGGSETAGFADGALYLDAQQHSYPALIAEQLKLVGGSTFLQPLTPDSNGFALVNGLLYARLALGDTMACNGDRVIKPVRVPETVGTFTSFVSASQAGPYGNWGVPFLKASDLTAPNANNNIYYPRMGAALAPKDAIAEREPKLFTICLGMEDILDYAINNGSIPASIFFYNYLLPLVDSLTQDSTAAGFIATLPIVTDFPFFNALPYNSLQLTQAEADALNATYTGTDISFAAGANAVVIQDGSMPNGKRQLKPTEKLLLSIPMDSITCGTWGSTMPISARYVLDEAEIAYIRAQTEAYNAILADMAAEKSLILVDLNALYAQVNQGVVVNALRLDNRWIEGGFFSLDGLNPSARGAALIANEFIKAMNANYNATIPLVSVTTQPGIRYP